MNIVSLLLFLTSFSKGYPPYTEDTLANGLQVIVVNKTELPITRALLTIKTGSLYDPPGKEGTAYLTTHLLDKGTKRRDEVEIAETVENLGGRLELDVKQQRINIGIMLLSEYTDTALDIIGDVSQNPLFLKEKFEKEKGKLLSSIQEDRTDPDKVIRQSFRRFVYGGHPLGNTPKGRLESVARITLKDIISFYNKYFAPNNAILVVVTDLSVEKTLTKVRSLFSGWERKKIVYPDIGQPEPLKGITVRIIDRDLNQAFIAIGHLGVSRNSPDFNRARAMNYILGGGGFSSRLYKKVRVEKGFAYSVYSYFYPEANYPGLFKCGLETKLENTANAIETVLEEIRKLQEEGATKDELKDTKTFYEGFIPQRTETYEQVASIFIDQKLYGLPPYFWIKDVEDINSLTLNDIRDAARSYLHPEDIVIVILGPKDSIRLDSSVFKKAKIYYEEF